MTSYHPDHQVESHILHLNRVHKELQIEETKARIKMYEAITRAAEKKARLEIHLTPSSQVKRFHVQHFFEARMQKFVKKKVLGQKVVSVRINKLTFKVFVLNFFI